MHVVFFCQFYESLFETDAMRTTLAPTTLSIGSTDDIKVKDSSTVTSTADNTSVKDMLLGMKDETVDALRKTPRLAQQLTKMAVDAKTGRLNATNVMSRLTSVFGGKGGIIDKLSTKTISVMSDTLGMDPKLAKRVMMTAKGIAGGSESILGYSTNVTSAQGLVSVLQRLSGDKDILKYVDLEAEASLLSGLLGEAVKLGIPSSVDLIIREATSEETKRKVISENIYAIVFSGNLNTVERLTQYMTPEQVRAKYPHFARDFLAQYTLTPADTTDKYPELKTKIITLFNSIDPNWDKSLRGSSYIPSLAPFTKASEDATKVFNTSPSYRSALVLAKKFASVDMRSWIKKHYAYFPA